MKKLWLSPPHLNGEEIKYIQEALDSNWIAPLGPNVDAFEEDICNYLGVNNAVAVVSGTAAIHLALIILDVNYGDEVLCQSFTFAGSAFPIIYQQAIPIFIDSEADSWNIDPQILEQAIRKRQKIGKKPKALILVHLYGQPAKLDEILEICAQYDIPVIEDGAEALGSRYNGKMVGTYGQFAILSFNGNKIITTSGGGMLIGSTDEIKKARFLSTQAQDDAPHYEHSQIGYNYRMSNIVAGIGRGQLKTLDQRVKQKRKIFDYYKNTLRKLPGVQFQPEMAGTHSNRWLTALIIDPELSGTSSENIRQSFESENIDVRPLWKPMHLQPVFKDAPKFENGLSEKFFNSGLCLPSGTAMSTEDLERVTTIFKSHF